MQLKFNAQINIDAITRRFKEAFGVSLTWHLLPNTEWVAFSIGKGYPLDPHEKTWLSNCYKPNAESSPPNNQTKPMSETETKSKPEAPKRGRPEGLAETPCYAVRCRWCAGDGWDSIYKAANGRKCRECGGTGRRNERGLATATKDPDC